jgi:hypothetical protein
MTTTMTMMLKPRETDSVEKVKIYDKKKYETKQRIVQK